MSKIKTIIEFQSAAEQLIEKFRSHALRHDFSHLNLQMLELIKVEYFGQKTAIKFTVKAVRQADGGVLLTPFVREHITTIYNALVNGAPDWTIVLQKDNIRIHSPVPTTENKEKVIKIISKEMENTKIQLRHYRQDLIKIYQEISSETERNRAKVALEKLFSKIIEDLTKVFTAQAERLRRV